MNPRMLAVAMIDGALGLALDRAVPEEYLRRLDDARTVAYWKLDCGQHRAMFCRACRELENIRLKGEAKP